MRLTARNACSGGQALHRTRTDDPFLTMEAEGVHSRAPQSPPAPKHPAPVAIHGALAGTRGDLRDAPRGRGTDALPIYTRFRDDGWPLCPRCGEDELYSLAIPATIETIVGCYRCGWRASSATRAADLRPADADP